MVPPSKPKLGYGQVICTKEASECRYERKEIFQAFLEATFEVWQTVIGNLMNGIKMVEEARTMVGLDDEQNDGWHESYDVELEMFKIAVCVSTKRESPGLEVVVPKHWD